MVLFHATRLGGSAQHQQLKVLAFKLQLRLPGAATCAATEWRLKPYRCALHEQQVLAQAQPTYGAN